MGGESRAELRVLNLQEILSSNLQLIVALLHQELVDEKVWSVANQYRVAAHGCFHAALQTVAVTVALFAPQGNVRDTHARGA